MPTITEKIISAHLIEGEMKRGEPIAIHIDQTLTQDATGTMAYLQLEAMGVEQVKTELSISYVDHNMILLTPWNRDRILVDPFCGSGTFPIEAAMMAAKMAPGMNRSFLAEEWRNVIKRKCWYEAMDEAGDLVEEDVQVDIQGYDVDGDIVKAARSNAQSAGVDHMIHFQRRPVSAMSHISPVSASITS